MSNGKYTTPDGLQVLGWGDLCAIRSDHLPAMISPGQWCLTGTLVVAIETGDFDLAEQTAIALRDLEYEVDRRRTKEQASG